MPPRARSNAPGARLKCGLPKQVRVRKAFKMKQGEKVEVTVEAVKDASVKTIGDEPSVVIETVSTVDGEWQDTSIEVRDADAPTMAAALLNADVVVPPTPANMPPAVQCLAIGIVHAAASGQMRLHLQFDSGQVLPIELSIDAAGALSRALVDHFKDR